MRSGVRVRQQCWMGALRLGRPAWDVDGFAEGHFAVRKGQRDLKAVPALRADLPAKPAGVGNNRQTGDLRQGHHAFLHDVARPPRTVGCHREVVAALGPRGQLEQGLRATPAGGSPHRRHTEVLEDGGEQRAVLAGADEGGQVVLLVKVADEALVNLHAQDQAVVPECEDDGFVGKLGGAVAAVDAVAQGGRQQAHRVGHPPRQHALAARGPIRYHHAADAFGPGRWTG